MWNRVTKVWDGVTVSGQNQHRAAQPNAFGTRLVWNRGATTCRVAAVQQCTVLRCTLTSAVSH